MYYIQITEGGHDWDKQNLVTLKDAKSMYDLMKCKNCGISGKRRSLNTLEINSNYNRDNVYTCKNAKKVGFKVPSRIQITKCYAQGAVFKNLTDGSIHNVVTPPEGYVNDSKGVWVMGVGEPVKVLSGEFEIIE